MNVLGSLLLGFAMAWLVDSMASTELRLFVAMGFLGSFTTFSTFSFEVLEMMREELWVRAGLYSLGSLVVGVGAVAIGSALALAVSRAG